jgi:hypothetical protein
MRLVLAITVLLATACSGDDDDGGECGAGEDGELAIGDIRIGGLHAGANNDCTPVQGDPTSVTIQGDQTSPDAAGFLVVCLPRPHEITGDPIALDDDRLVQQVQLSARDPDDCALALDEDGALGAATMTVTGFCDQGTHPDGFAIALGGTLPATRTCGDADPEAIDLPLSGAAPVLADEI